MEVQRWREAEANMGLTFGTQQIGFLTEWQMYAQNIEGETWKGERLDSGKIDKMSGMSSVPCFDAWWFLGGVVGLTIGWNRSAARAALRAYAGYSEERAGGG